MNVTLLHQSKNTTISLDTDKNQIIKSLQKISPSKIELQKFKNEYEILQGVDISGVRKVLAYENQSIFLEYVEGKTLKEFVGSITLSLIEKVYYLKQVAEIIGAIHQSGIIHKDISPSNILITPKNEVYLIDFGISSRFTLKQPNLGNPEKLEGALYYISPEQTGRMNRTVDYRTDLYALGATFYELLTNKTVFEEKDAMGLVHAHLAKTPQSPSDIDKTIPYPISKITLKLLEKNPEERYQSALGLTKDLEKCLNYLEENQEVSDFELGQEDFSGKLQIPEKLYGREQERKVILEAFERVKAGSVELTLVAGYSGTGKSVLINETHPPLTSTKGYFIEGKFDQYKRNIPFSAWIQAFKNLVDLLLTENEETLQYWKNIVLGAVGDNAGVLTEVIPSLELVIGKQAEVSVLGGQEAQNRFNYVMQNFVRAITTEEHPLIIFIDDLQWADLASLNLLKILVTDKENAYLLCVGAYRDNEVSATHSLTTTLKEIEADSYNINKIQIGNLSKEAVLEMLAETLDSSKNEKLRILEQNILSKTQGNAFFTHQFLKNLYEEELLKFDFEQKKWTWDNAKIQAANFTDNVVELMTKKVNTLPENAQDLLKLSACIGNKFDLGILQIIAKKEEIRPDLDKAVLEGLIFPTKNNQYKFVHDRIQQAAYSLIPEHQKQAGHLEIGRLLYQKCSEEDREERLFDITNHYNMGQEIFTEKDRETAIELNYKATLKARASASFDTMLNYAQQAKDLLQEDTWQSNYAQAFKIYHIFAKAAYLNRRGEMLVKAVEEGVAQSQDVLDKAELLLWLLQQRRDEGNAEELPKTTDELLDIFEINDMEAEEAALEKQMQELIGWVFQQINELGFEKVLHLPASTKRKVLLLQEAFTIFPNVSIRLEDWTKATLFMFKHLEYALQEGHTVFSGNSFALTGPVACLMGQYEMGYQLVQLGLQLGERFDDKGVQCQALQVLSYGVNHWRYPISESKIHALKGIQIGQESGNLFFLTGCMINYAWATFVAGQNIQTIVEEWEKKYGYPLFKYNIELPNNLMIALRWVLNDLVSEKIESIEVAGEKQTEEEVKDFPYIFAIHKYYAHKAQTYFILGNYDKALHFHDLVNVRNVYTFFSLFEYNFYGSLIQLHHYEKAPNAERMEKVKANQAQMQIWVENCPENFLHKHQLVEAELARIAKDSLEKVLRLYKEAIKQAKAEGFVQDAAIANELCAKYLLNSDFSELAQVYLREAYILYQRWGATAKTNQMIEKYSEILIDKTTTVSNTLNTTQVTYDSEVFTNTTQRGFDLDTVLKANATLSQQVRLKDLIVEMLELLSKNSGANKIAFLRKDIEYWLVEADEENGQNLLTQAQPFEHYPHLPKQVITYVMRSKEYILLDDVSQNQQFNKDPYFKEKNSKSIFVIPVKKQEEILAILYLENNLNTGVFHKKRYELISALVTQLAISMENTLLYENLEEKVQQRTFELQEAYEETQVMNEELRQTQEELETQRDFVEEQNHELQKFNQKLQSSEKILKKMNDSIKEKNKELAQTNSQVASSINSAKTIQEAILPQTTKLEELLQDYFIINHPKDVVSGDFYWMNELEEKTILVVADCTGHGVPGAFMTLIGANLLDKIVTLESIHHPDLILEALHKEVQHFLKQKYTQNNNGMDAVIITFEKHKDNQFKLTFAGAKNNLLVYSNEGLQELKGTRKSIGGIQNEEIQFESQEVTLNQGDLIYLGSDGLEDQNDEKRKKFGRNRIKSIIQENHHLPLSEQKQKFEQALEQHMKNELQRDDILWMGIRL